MPEPAANLSALHESRAREAQLLADMLRISRLTVLYGASGTGKTTLLATGVLPLLRRRAADRKPTQPAEPRVVIPFPHCRRTDRTARAEVALFFDEWDGLPLARLSTWLLSALPSGGGSLIGAPFPSLAENLALWNKELGVRFLILLDQFEQFLTAPRNRPGIPEFDDEFARVLGDPRLPVNFLVSVREDAEPLMERLRASMTGLGDASLRLYPLDMPRSSALQPRPESLRAAMAPAFVGAPSLAAVEDAEENSSAATDGATSAEVSDAPASVEPQSATEMPALADMPDARSAEATDLAPATAAVESETAEMPQEAPIAVEVPQFEVPVMELEEPETRHDIAIADDVAVAALEREAISDHAPPANAELAPPADAEPAPPADAELAAPDGAALPEQETPAVASAPVEIPHAIDERPSPTASEVEPLQTPTRPQEQSRIETAVAPRTSAKTWMPVLKWAAASGAFVALLFIVWAAQHFPAEPLPLRVAPELAQSEPAAPAAVKAEAPPAPNFPPVALAVEPGNSTDAEIARDFARFVAPDAGARIAMRQDGVTSADDETPRLAIMRYEALDAAARSKPRSGAAPEKLRIVTPLYTEEIYVIVRRDSPFTFIHEIRDTRINVGPERSDRRLTAARLYERMFGAPMQPANVSTLTDDEALSKLVKDKSIDAMIVVAGQPAKWLKDLAPELGRSIKLLKLDRAHPVGQKAIEAYLPTIVRAAHYGKWLSEDVPSLATMSFLVASESSNAAAAERLDGFLRAVCRNAAKLRQQGHPKWREVQLGLELETGWPYLASARDAFSACLPR
jgi:uncharacterized protein